MPGWNSNRMDQLLYAADTHGHVYPSFIPPNPTQRVGNVTPTRRWISPQDKMGRTLGQSAVAVPVGAWEACSPPPTTPSRRGSAQSARSSRPTPPQGARQQADMYRSPKKWVEKPPPQIPADQPLNPCSGSGKYPTYYPTSYGILP
jgi:hypothetical protein